MTLRLVRCAHCADVYVRQLVQTASMCPSCQEEPSWEPYDPRTASVPDIRDLPNLMAGLLSLLEQAEQLEDATGYVPCAVVDALSCLAQGDPEYLKHLWMENSILFTVSNAR